MRNLNEHNMTEAVNQRWAACENPRLKQIMEALTRHLHDFIREVELTEEEWFKAIQFLTATGHMCDDKRQEFILLSDTLGASMLTVALNNRKPVGATEATVFGPFHIENPPEFPNGADISNGAPGEPCFVSGTVRGINGEPIPGAELDVWQADEQGLYDVQYQDGPLRARGLIRADDEGRFAFRTVVPLAYPIPTDGPVGQMLLATKRHPWRPAHMHFMVAAPGYERLITHVFRDDDAYLDSDAVFGVRSSLITHYERHEDPGEIAERGVGRAFYTLDYDFVLPRAS